MVESASESALVQVLGGVVVFLSFMALAVQCAPGEVIAWGLHPKSQIFISLDNDLEALGRPAMTLT
jgi:hypothetical protein